MKYTDALANKKLKLCYIEPRTDTAWFTTAELKDQWGDDWNDSPYEHNAGLPYDYDLQSRCEKSTDRYELFKIKFETNSRTPEQLSKTGNSDFSVQAINKGFTPWLRPETNYETGPVIYAGCTLIDFITKILEHNGDIFISTKSAIADSLDENQKEMFYKN